MVHVTQLQHVVTMDTTNLIRVDEDEQVVHAHGQYQKGYHLQNNECGRHLHVAIEAQRRHHRHQHQEHSKQAHHQLGVNLVGGAAKKS